MKLKSEILNWKKSDNKVKGNIEWHSKTAQETQTENLNIFDSNENLPVILKTHQSQKTTV